MIDKTKKRIISAINNPRKIIIFAQNKGVLNIIPDRLYLKLLYYNNFGKKLNLNNPKTFNEKLQWLKLYDRNPLYTKLVDKYEVRKHIVGVISGEYLIPLVGAWDRFADIDFSKLPNQFVLKCTHDSGGLVICTDKSKLDIEAIRKKIDKCLKRNFYYIGREWPYKNVKPRIICEKYMVDESGVELKDYKIFCFSGEPKIIQVDYNRFVGHKRNLYDTKWNYTPASIQYPTDPKVKIKKPDRLETMLELARILAKDYPHVRVDFYSINNKIYFGELTYHHGSGFEKFEPESLGEQMGSWIKLPCDK
jgi:hypothetical protein